MADYWEDCVRFVLKEREHERERERERKERNVQLKFESYSPTPKPICGIFGTGVSPVCVGDTIPLNNVLPPGAATLGAGACG